MSGDRNLLEAGHTYIIDELEPRLSVSLFEEAVSAGNAGLFVSNEPPEFVRRRLKVKDNIETAWVTDVTSAGALKPAMLDQINARRERFLERHAKSAILFDIFNVLMSANDFSNVFKFFNYLRDDTHRRDSITLISLDSKSLDVSQFRRIRRLAIDMFSEDNPPDMFLETLPLREGKTYIFTSGEARAYRMVSEASRAGRLVLCLVRDYPDAVREARSLPPEVQMLWLSRTGHTLALRPSEVSMKIASALDRGKTVVLIDGLDILIAEMGFNELYRIISHMMDLARVSGGNLLIHVPKSSMSADELRRLSQGAEMI